MGDEHILALDLGASKLESASGTRSAIARCGGEWPTDRSGAQSGMGLLVRWPVPARIDARRLLERVRELVREQEPRRVGFALPGFVQAGAVRDLPNLPNVEAGRLRAGLREMGVPIVVENDVRAMALAHWVARGQSEEDDFLLVAPGSGIGGAIVAEGRLRRGAHGTAGEVGHMPLGRGSGDWRGDAREGERDADGLEWERGCGGLGIERRFARAGWEARRILESDDPSARRLGDAVARELGVGLAGLAAALDPAEIILGGGVGGAMMRDRRRAALVREAYARAAIGPVRKTPIRLSTLRHPVLAGAGLVAIGERDRRIRRFMRI